MGFMFLRGCCHQIKTVIILIGIAVGLVVVSIQDSFSEAVSIKNSMKIHRMGGYVIVINYETEDKWTDNLLFKVYCRFNQGELEFVSSALNNIERGWHKIEIGISDIIKKRYGSLINYRIDLYKNGILVDSKKSY